MLERYKVLSGEFSLVIREKDCESAALESVRLHFDSNHHTCLGEITMVESKKDTKFFFTQNLIDDIFCSSPACSSNR